MVNKVLIESKLKGCDRLISQILHRHSLVDYYQVRAVLISAAEHGHFKARWNNPVSGYAENFVY